MKKTFIKIKKFCKVFGQGVVTRAVDDDPGWEFAAHLPTQEEMDRFSFDPPDAAKLIPKNRLFKDV